MFLKQQQVGDRMIAVVGMLVAVSIAALLGFAVLVAQRVDQDSAERERELARGVLAALEPRMRNELASFAHWDEAVDRTTRTLDQDWIHRNYGLRLYEANGHDRSFILGAGGEPIYASIDGVQADHKLYHSVRPKLHPFVAQVREAYVEAFSARIDEGGTANGLGRPVEPKFVTAFRRIDDRPALVGAITIVPNLNRASLQGSKPAVAVSIAFLDAALLQTFAREIAIQRVTLHDGPLADSPTANGKIAIEVPLAPDENLAWLTWTPRAPGAAVLSRLLPGLLAIAALIGMITLLVLFNVRRTAERLLLSERRARELAYRDGLTGLANRVQLLETLAERLPETRADQRLALFLIDLDGFKDINDTLGHPVGDEVLFAVGERLASGIGDRGIAVRYGGDEFALVAPTGEGNEEVLSICRRVAESLRAPILASGQHLTIDATIGVAIAPDDALEPEQLLRRADIALYRAKAEGRGGYRLFETSFEELLQKRSVIERELTRALDRNELAISFQPLMAVDGERMVGVEALVRWNHPERGVVPPSEFIPVAEQSGLVVRLDEWVLRRACEYAAEWPGLSLAVNLSATNFRRSNVAERVRRVLAETGFDPRRLEIEITESMLLGATPEVLGALSEMRRMGIRIALDDFGTGYSSLGYLRRFPVDKLKIDQSFVQNLGITEDAAAIVECVARLGRALGLAVTAEGVETREQHRFVLAVGCHQVQGYLFSPPLEPEQVSVTLRPETTAQFHKDNSTLATA